MLYSYKGKYPSLLPYRIRLSDGSTRTDPTTFTAEMIEDAGYIQVPKMPGSNSTHVPYWSSETTSWVMREKTEQEIAEELDIIKSKINRERDNRIAAGFVFDGNAFDSRPEDQKRISGAATLAFMSVIEGTGTVNNFLWHGGVEPFGWISKDNTIVQMDAPTVINFGKKAANWESVHVFAARQLKDMNPVPADFTNDIYWPEREVGISANTSANT